MAGRKTRGARWPGRVLLPVVFAFGVLDLAAEPPSAYAQPPALIAQTAAELALKAESDGSVRLIVGVDAPFEPAGGTRTASALAQQQRIRDRQDALMARVAGRNIVEKVRLRHIPFIALISDARGVEALASAPEVISIEEDVAEPPFLSSSIPVIGAQVAWDAGFDGAGQVVAVLDTGVDKSHPYFLPGNKVVSEACYSTSGGSSSSVCPGGVSESTDEGSGVHCDPAVSGCAHGTHVAGIAVGNDGVGPHFGVARGAELIAIQVFSRFDSQGSCGGTPAPCALAWISDQIRGLERVLELSDSLAIAAVNMSLGGGRYFDEASCDAAQAARKAAIDNLRAVEIVVAAASGNSGYRDSTHAPACISSSISVGSTTDEDAVSGFSNIADFIDLLAPGTAITSSLPGEGTGSWNGTSMAAPHVAGAWAILRQISAGASVDAVLAALRDTGASVDDERSGGSVTDMRRINVDQAMVLLGGPGPELDPTPPAGSMIDLGGVPVGATTGMSSVTIDNLGDLDLTLSCALGGTDAPHFDIEACPATVPPSATDSVSVSCTPLSGGALSASLELTTNDFDEMSVSYTLNCSGLGPEFDSTPIPASMLDFGDVGLDAASDPLSVQVGNLGTSELTLGCSLSGSDWDTFDITQCPAAVAPAAGADILVTCSPDSIGLKSASLDLTTNDADEGNGSYALTCNGIAAEFESTPEAGSSFDFGEVEVGASSEALSLAVENEGNIDLTLACALSGDDAAAFNISQCPAAVAPESSVEVQFNCAPENIGGKSASLDLMTNDADEGSVSYSLACQGHVEFIRRHGFEDPEPD